MVRAETPGLHSSGEPTENSFQGGEKSPAAWLEFSIQPSLRLLVPPSNCRSMHRCTKYLSPGTGIPPVSSQHYLFAPA